MPRKGFEPPLQINGTRPSTYFVSPPLKFVFALDASDPPPATLAVHVRARDSDGRELTGVDTEDFTADGCNRYVVLLAYSAEDGGPKEAGVDGAAGLAFGEAESWGPCSLFVASIAEPTLYRVAAGQIGSAPPR